VRKYKAAAADIPMTLNIVEKERKTILILVNINLG
jgi:hypothetical protein